MANSHPRRSGMDLKIDSVKTVCRKRPKFCFRYSAYGMQNTLGPFPQTLSPIEVQIPTSNKQQYQVAPNESSKDAKISPSVIKGYSERCIELITDFVCAICTIRSLVID